jgi:hypothetical protein
MNTAHKSGERQWNDQHLDIEKVYLQSSILKARSFKSFIGMGFSRN